MRVIQNCVHCIYFNHRPGEMHEMLGECRRHAPLISLGTHSMWPYVNETDWCGDFKQPDPDGRKIDK